MRLIWLPYWALMGSEDGDWNAGRSYKITPPPAQPELPPANTRMLRNYRRLLDAECGKITARILKEGRRKGWTEVVLHVWGRERQRAMMENGWEPLVEQGADLTLRLTIYPG